MKKCHTLNKIYVNTTVAGKCLQTKTFAKGFTLNKIYVNTTVAGKCLQTKTFAKGIYLQVHTAVLCRSCSRSGFENTRSTLKVSKRKKIRLRAKTLACYMLHL